MPADKNNLIWLDLEMTGLDPIKNKIIEIATVVTDSQLNIVAEGPSLAVSQPKELLDAMDQWNTSHHTKSGLIDRVIQSTVSEGDAEKETLNFLKEHTLSGHSPMCGNSICQDRRFLYRYMPKLASFFHYRNLDVSTLKILVQHWAPAIASQYSKESKHLALSDVYDSIEELRHYREKFIQK